MKTLRCLSLLLALILGGSFFPELSAAAETKGRFAPARGMLLVATEGMQDPRFVRSVILLLDYGRKGAVGVILNRPARLTLGEALGAELGLPDSRRPIFFGGPVDSSAVTTVLRADEAPVGASRITETLWLVPVEEMTAVLQGEAGEETVRVMAGYAGWAAMQLATEIAQGAWYVAPCDDQLVFETPPGRLWDVLRARGDEVWI